MKTTTSGFTIVELLIVIVVIAILAAISVVAYNGIQNRANDTVVVNDLNAMKKQVMLFQAGAGVYPAPTQYFNVNGQDDMKQVPISKSSYDTSVYNYYYCTDISRNNFGIAIRSKSGQTYTISSTDNIRAISGIPQWTAACGAFGGNVLAEVEFRYGYNLANKTWSYGL